MTTARLLRTILCVGIRLVVTDNMYVIPYRDKEHSQGGKTTLMEDK